MPVYDLCIDGVNPSMSFAKFGPAYTLLMANRAEVVVGYLQASHSTISKSMSCLLWPMAYDGVGSLFI